MGIKTLEELIEQGYEVKKSCYKASSMTGPYMAGEKYDEWLMCCIRYLTQFYPDEYLTNDFIEIAKKASGKSVTYFNQLLGILKALIEIPSIPKSDNIDMLLEKICINFHRCAKSILNRHNQRNTLIINDEYDVQDLLQGILRLFIDDVRPEDYVPSYAGANSRIDFYLPKYDTYIETKMTREGLTDKKIGEELIIDIARYRDKCSKLICFIYDKQGMLSNPYGLITDLNNLSTNELQVKVYISPN